MSLFKSLATLVSDWRTKNYHHDTFPAISEILEWAANPHGDGYRLRIPQIHALETYWYLRLVEQTPKIPDLYRQVFRYDPVQLLTALGLPKNEIDGAIGWFKDQAVDQVLERVRTDNDYAKKFKLDALRETLNLNYPSYIFALAMGAGKTALIGAIIATEFAMAQEYPEGDFVQNALVFAPGKAIVESLRELLTLPYERIIPLRMVKPFTASLKIIFTRDGEKDIPVIGGSVFNVVVTNTGKIRIRKETIRKADLGSFLPSLEKEDEAKANVANLRLQKIASLPHLGIFSDEAHHTYGNALGSDLKKVRQTVDYLAEQTNLICVVNTTGTPYYKKLLLRDVVIWYGLSQGIKDGILKEVSSNIFAYDLTGNCTDQFVTHVVENFFNRYRNVKLPDGSPAKLALYFPQTDDLETMRPVLEAKLAELGLPPTSVLTHTSKSGQETRQAFNRLNDPHSPHRVIMLVNIGTEGWNCPSLFATALARRLKGRNNFVLQTASRCLRQTPGNTAKASIYLSMDNQSVLDKQLQETYGETIHDLSQAITRSARATITLRKLDIPPLTVRRVIRTLIPKPRATLTFTLTRPAIDDESLMVTRLDIAEQIAAGSVLAQVGDTVTVETVPQITDLYAAAVELAALYRLDIWMVYDELARLYPETEIPHNHLSVLAQQLEIQTSDYEIKKEIVEQTLALVKPEGFTLDMDEDGNVVYTAEITYPLDKGHLLLSWEQWLDHGKDKDGLGFHYSPYNFDSRPELDFFDRLLDRLNVDKHQIEDVYFTGAITDPKKTDFYVQYKGEDDRWHNYTPDFVIKCKNGHCLIVEIKAAKFRAGIENDLAQHTAGKPAVTVEGRKAIALQRWTNLNPDQLKYQLAYGNTTINYNHVEDAIHFVEDCSE